MKKIALLNMFMILILLTACNIPGLGKQKQITEIEVCTDNCVTNETHVDEIDEISGEYVTYLDNYFYDLDMCVYDEVYEIQNNITRRVNIPNDKSMRTSYKLNFTHPLDTLSKGMYDLIGVVKSCDPDDGCDMSSFREYHDVKNVEYEFNITSGRYYLEEFKDYKLYARHEVMFDIENVPPKILKTSYYDDVNALMYRFFSNNEYYSYGITPSETTFFYVNLTTLESIYVMFSDEILKMTYYDHETEMFYSYRINPTIYEVAKYHDFEFETSLFFTEERFHNTINFQLVDGWDSFHRSNNWSFGGDLSKDDEIVFSHFEISAKARGNYVFINGTYRLENNESDSYVFPSEFNTSTSFDELLERYDYFSTLESPFDIVEGFTLDEIRENAEELLEIYSNKYSEGEE